MELATMGHQAVLRRELNSMATVNTVSARMQRFSERGLK